MKVNRPSKVQPTTEGVKLTPDKIAFLKEKMTHLARRNPSWGIRADDFAVLFEYLAVQKITYLYDDELFEGLTFVDHKKTGKSEELLDAYLVLDAGDEIQLKLFQFKFREGYDGGISTKELYAFVDRMNRVFLRGDLQDTRTLEAFKEARGALDEALKGNKRARTRIQCYLKHQRQIDELMDKASRQDRKTDVARQLADAVSAKAKAAQEEAQKVFHQALKDYLAEAGGNEDAALKNSEFARQVDTLATK